MFKPKLHTHHQLDSNYCASRFLDDRPLRRSTSYPRYQVLKVQWCCCSSSRWWWKSWVTIFSCSHKQEHQYYFLRSTHNKTQTPKTISNERKRTKVPDAQRENKQQWANFSIKSSRTSTAILHPGIKLHQVRKFQTKRMVILYFLKGNKLTFQCGVLAGMLSIIGCSTLRQSCSISIKSCLLV